MRRKRVGLSFSFLSNTNNIIANEKLTSFEAIIPLLMRNTEKGNSVGFPALEEVVKEDEPISRDFVTAI